MISRLLNPVFRLFRSKDLKFDNKDHLETLTPDELGRLVLSEVWEGSTDIRYIKDLIAVGCPIDVRDDFGWTALHRASNWGRLEVAKLLVSKGAQLDVRDNDGRTALHCVARNGHLKVVKFLVSRGAQLDVGDDEGRTALHLAAQVGNLKVLKFLISRGVDINTRDARGRKAWDVATWKIKASYPELKPK